MKNHHISEAGVSFEIQFGLCIKIRAGEHIFFYIWQQTIALNDALIPGMHRGGNRHHEAENMWRKPMFRQHGPASRHVIPRRTTGLCRCGQL